MSAQAPPPAAPIEPATVSLVLSYLVPLDSPLPPHLLSRPLLKRHHFLSLEIDDPVAYLAWPSNDRDAAISQLLSGESHLPDDLHLNVRYSADDDALTAHVHLPSTTSSGSGGGSKMPCSTSGSDPSLPSSPPKELRLIFQHDPTEGWQYHNTSFMPFPRDTFPTIAGAYGALAAPGPDDFLAEQSHYGDHLVTVAGADDDDDDSYWNSYGQDVDEDPDAPQKSGGLKSHPDPNSEDAYWARYSSIHGTADSTIPSPLPVKRTADGTQTHLFDDDDNTSSRTSSERIFVPSTTLVPDAGDTELYNPLEPPSPDALSRRLATLQAVRAASPPEEEEEDCSSVEDPSEGPEPAESALGLEETQGQRPLSGSTVGSHRDEDVLLSEVKPSSETSSSDIEIESAADAAVKQSIQGLYALWKLDLQRQALAPSEEAFLALVRGAIAT
ncbi:hypothetical protein DFP72DRAFT_1872 [Ephemerocybe angulata]|uniref:Uncharacterized protein n=1 Tax=Ephemerocybe angulata TaxID=980116 RepID=A0A8H6IJZ7_9AGAR|nr:hypothetical protein DFP72DRAFT_1872 [Tulosesus angulatus]